MNTIAGYAKLRVCSFGIACGIAKGLGMLSLAWAAMQFGYGTALVALVASVYHGYAATLMGGLYGFGWGLLDGFICGVVIAIFYNCCLNCCKKK